MSTNLSPIVLDPYSPTDADPEDRLTAIIRRVEEMLQAYQDPFISASLPRHDATADLGSSFLTSGTVMTTTIALLAGQVVTKLGFVAGATALNAGTHQVFGLYDSSGNLLAHSADDTSTAWSAGAKKELAMTAAYTVPKTGLYRAAILVAATTAVPSLMGAASVATASATINGLAGTNRTATADSSVTALAATLGTQTAVGGVPFCYVL